VARHAVQTIRRRRLKMKHTILTALVILSFDDRKLMVLRVVYFIMQVISITNLLYGLCEAEFTVTKYAADRISSLSTPRRLIVELGNGSSGPTRSVPTFTSSAVPEYGDRISEVIAQLLFV